MTLLFLAVAIVIVARVIVLLTGKNSIVFAKLLLRVFNYVESKLARLSCRSLLVDELDVFYLSNTSQFNHAKPVLVLLHGFSADKYIWNRFARRFSARYQLLIPDLKGYGQTVYDTNDDYSVPSQCKMLLGLLNHLQIKSFSIVGNSMGGMMAAKLLDEIPERIDKSVLIDPAGAKSEFVKKMVEQQNNPIAHRIEQDFFNFFHLIMHKPPYVPMFMLRVLARDFIDKRAQYIDMFNQFYNLRDFYPSDYRFDCPKVMLIWGLNDRVLPIEDYTQWKTMLNANTQVYEDLGHIPMVEDVKRVSKDIMRFLQN